MKHSDIPRAGIVTTRNWLKTPDGDQHQAFWSAEWSLLTDKEMELSGIRSSDRWTAIAFAGDEVLAIIPGCQVIAYMPCLKPPPHGAYIFRRS